MIAAYRTGMHRAHRLAWLARTPERQRDAWWLCWHLAIKAGYKGSGPNGVWLPGNHWLLPPGSPFYRV